MKSDFNECEIVYWVFTQLCNDQCGHCYNNSGPHGQRITEEDCLNIIANMPNKIGKVILSGGEPLAEKNKLYLILDALIEKYGRSQIISIQTNGDLMNEKILDTLLAKGLKSINIASLDRYHKHQGSRLDVLKTLFDSRGMIDNTEFMLDEDKQKKMPEDAIIYSYFGANEQMWLGGNWARGRAFNNNIWMQNPEHNFCKIRSGARNFLGGHTDTVQEVCIQLWAINPCCPGTKFPMGDARTEKVADVLLRMTHSPIFQQLNNGEPYKMGESLGITEQFAKERGKDLKNICLWCDEFFTEYANKVV